MSDKDYIQKSAYDTDFRSNNGSIHSCCIHVSCAAATRYTEPTVTNNIQLLPHLPLVNCRLTLNQIYWVWVGDPMSRSIDAIGTVGVPTVYLCATA